jgi:DNA-binding HxlR family transcriptional regulator
MESVFDSKNHYSYLREHLQSRPSARGIKGRFAEHVRVQPAFLSQVLAEKYPLSLEQADLANSFLEHSIEESEFFLLMVSRDRAGTVSLKKHFTKQIEQARKRRMEVIERLGRKTEISEDTKGVFFSSWIYAAAHVATTVPDLRKLTALREYLGVNNEVLLKTLQFLENHGLVVRKGDEYLPTQNWIRLDRQSPHVIKMHNNWRQKAMQNIEVQKDEDLHFSGVYSLDAKTALAIRDELLDGISRQVKKIEKAPEEGLYVLGVDFFNLRQSL